MLTELRIRNFALIEDLSVRLGPGLNVLTGETGAGKSIIVGALSLLLGERATADVVRAGAERASVEGVFEVAGGGSVAQLLGEAGIEAEDGLVILKREVALEGRNRAWINGSPTTAGLLGEIGAELVDLHGQHEHQSLLRREEQRHILDAYAGTEPLLAEVRAAHQERQRLQRQIAELQDRRREALQRADLLRFQVDEIDDAAPRAGEEAELEEEQNRLSHSEDLLELSAALHEAIGGDDGIVERLAALRRTVDQLLRIDRSQAAVQELYDTAYYSVEELGTRMEQYQAGVEHDPARLEEIRRRRDLLFRLKSKYGPELEDVIRTGEEARSELELIDNAEWELSGLQKREGEAAADLERVAAELSERRRSGMQRLAGEVDAVLPELGMSGGRFTAEALPLSEPGSGGAEEIEFRVSLNRGFEPKPLAQVASGGEMSRVMLALKTILARLDSVPTLVFDEVDAGIGGKVALQVGDKMREVANSHQVFAITHLPQIASRAHSHLLVRKRESGAMTSTDVVVLENQERVAEVARMLGGDPESEVSLEHARELLSRGAPVA